MSLRSFKEKLDKLIGLDDEFDDDDEEIEELTKEPAETPPVFLRDEKVRPLPRETQKLPQEKLSVAIFAPKSISDCKEPADKLKCGAFVIIDYNLTTTTEARHCYFFMQGLVYALDGKSEKISNSIFLYAPAEKTISKKNIHSASLDDILRLNWGLKNETKK